MTKSLKIDERLEKYISDHSYDLHPVQKEILNHNDSLGDVKRMQISVTQAYFFQFFIKCLNNYSKGKLGGIPISSSPPKIAIVNPAITNAVKPSTSG